MKTRIILGLTVVACLAGCASVTPPTAPPAAIAAETTDSVIVYVVYNHFHSGLTVPSAALAETPGPTADAQAQLTPQPWTSLGYGDAKFYEGRGINPSRILDFFRSMLAPGNPSVVHLEGVDDPLKDPSHPKLLKLSISRQRFSALVSRVDQTFALHDGQPEFLLSGLDANDKFYRGLRPASAIHECNQWIGEVLGAAGVPHSPLLDTTSDGLALDLKSSGQVIAIKPI